MKTPNWVQLREQMPAALHSTYLNSAASAPYSNLIYQTVREHIDTLHNTGDVFWMDNFTRLEETRGLAAELLQTDSNAVGFGSSTSQNMSLLALSLKSSHGLGEVVVPEAEFPSTYLPWKYHGFHLKTVPLREDGSLPAEDLLAACGPKTKAILTSHVLSFTGYKQDLQCLGEGAKELKIPLLINATQSLGVHPIKMKEWHISAVLCSCHKWLGAGYGVSIMALSEDYQEHFHSPIAGWLSTKEPMFSIEQSISWKKSTAAIEVGSLPMATLLALNTSLKFFLETGVENLSRYVLGLAEDYRQKALQAGLLIIGFHDNEQDLYKTRNSSIVLLKVDDPEAWEEKLIAQKIIVSARAGGIRAAFHYFNTTDDGDKLIEALRL